MLVITKQHVSDNEICTQAFHKESCISFFSLSLVYHDFLVCSPTIRIPMMIVTIIAIADSMFGIVSLSPASPPSSSSSSPFPSPSCSCCCCCSFSSAPLSYTHITTHTCPCTIACSHTCLCVHCTALCAGRGIRIRMSAAASGDSIRYMHDDQ